MSGPARVVVVGGGISGLAAALALRSHLADAEITVLEAAAHVGGKLAVGEVAGVPVDLGAESVLARRPEAVELIRALGLGDELVEPVTTSALVRAAGTLHPLPTRTMLGIPADLAALRASGVLSPAAVAAVEAEPGLPPLAPLDGDVAVGAVVRDRLGDEVADRLVEPLLGGVYAGRVDELSLRATMPALWGRLAAEGGSLVRAAQAAAAAATGSADERTTPGAVFASLAGGLGRLPQRLAGSGLFTVRTGVTVRSIRRTPTGFALDCGAVPVSELVEADAVVVAVPAAKAARLLRGVADEAAAELAGIESASIAITTLAYREADLPAGSGVLVAAREGLTVKASTFSSQKWPMATGGLVVLRASVGRAGDAAVLQRDDEDLVAVVRRDLRALVGLTAEPVDAVVTRWGGGLPQYAVGHVERVERVHRSVGAVPGLAVCGAAYDGVGIPACIASAYRAAGSVLVHLERRG